MRFDGSMCLTIELQGSFRVVRGECTVNAAANVMQLPSSTLHPYVHKARTSLGLLLPPQASGPTLWTSNKKLHETGNSM